MAHRRADLVLGVVVAALGAYALSTALSLSLFSKKHVPGPGLFPTLVSSALLVLGVLLAALSTKDLVRRRHAGPADADGAVGEAADSDPVDAAADGSVVTPQRLLRAGAVFGCFAVGAGLMGVLGFVPAAAIVIVLVLFGIERRRDWRALLAAVLIPSASFFLFVHLLSIQLPNGLLDLGPLSSF